MNDTTMLKRKDGLMTADLNGDTVMMDMITGKYYNLGGVGGDIWNILEQEMTEAELVSKLVTIYDVTEEQCRKDVHAFLEKMVERGLIIQRD